MLSACKKEYDVVYGVNKTKAIQNATKDKLKSDEQFIAVLYANLFGKGISVKDMTSIQQLVTSIGDKKLAYELIVSDFMNDPAVILPSATEMRSNPDKFIDETYQRFYVRNPTQIEREWWKNYIKNHASISPELVYISFSTSDEFFHY
jgi:hypothetical protein